jgi:hypothetical protein
VLNPHPRAAISREEKAFKTNQKNSIPVARSKVANILKSKAECVIIFVRGHFLQAPVYRIDR